ncbi:type II toxin-antitoxin system RelE/ParE family toxin [Candidatus Sulfurimonas baltica]|uniref:Type II toxin-antitoxin system RelE/ParE family toxin n=1 Tax=Candidatus Sulfurimonas baltica TaxID=2740404 RepID=A0A7S7RP33_9BACT|nr:type II toxin-antitoxin system RelE/ParE family toxin [Candidatus Sulfurimonas baltica]
MAITKLSKYKIAETKTFEKIKKKIDKKLYSKIESFVYPQLRENPFFGSNIKKLKGNLEGYYRYQIGNYRLFYLIEDEKLIIVIVDFRHRQQAYD